MARGSICLAVQAPALPSFPALASPMALLRPLLAMPTSHLPGREALDATSCRRRRSCTCAHGTGWIPFQYVGRQSGGAARRGHGGTPLLMSAGTGFRRRFHPRWCTHRSRRRHTARRAASSFFKRLGSSTVWWCDASVTLRRDLNLTANPPAGMRALFFYQLTARVAASSCFAAPRDHSTASGRAYLSLGDVHPRQIRHAAEAAANSRRRRWITGARRRLCCGGGDGAPGALAPLHRPLARRAARRDHSASRAPVGPAVGFRRRRGATRSPTAHRAACRRFDAARSNLYALASKWDPVQARAVQAGGLVGDACYWFRCRRRPAARRASPTASFERPPRASCASSVRTFTRTTCTTSNPAAAAVQRIT